LTLTKFYIWCTPSPFTEGVPRRRSVGGAGRRRLQARFATSSQEARSPSAPDEGAALDGCDSSDEGWRKCCLDNVSGNSLRSDEEVRWPCQKSPRWSAGRRACRSFGRRGAFAKVPIVICAVSALRLPQGRQNRDPGGSPGGRDREIWRSAGKRRAEPEALGPMMRETAGRRPFPMQYQYFNRFLVKPGVAA
jgi:hypothetical protein